jgi:hypothetical protein
MADLVTQYCGLDIAVVEPSRGPHSSTDHYVEWSWNWEYPHLAPRGKVMNSLFHLRRLQIIIKLSTRQY